MACAFTPAFRRAHRQAATRLTSCATGDPARYGGREVRTAVANIATLLAPAVAGLDPADQSEIDAALLAADGTPEKSRAGANAVLAVSLAAARAGARSRGIPLWRQLIGDGVPVMPRPMINLISGGLHARRNLDLQDFLIIPVGAATYPEALEASSAVIEATGAILQERGLSTLHADEGGFGPALANHREALELACAAVQRAGLRVGDDIAFALDVAATHFHDPATGLYELASEGLAMDATGMIELLEGWMGEFPIVSIEDPLGEDDWAGWSLTLHAPLTAATRNVVDATFLGEMKPGAVLINAARGPLVDQAALAGALRSGAIAGAGLDVFDPECLPPDHPLLSAPNVVLTPHVAFYSEESIGELRRKGAEAVAAILAGRPAPSVVNAQAIADRARGAASPPKQQASPQAQPVPS
jgi:hypothetical protein